MGEHASGLLIAERISPFLDHCADLGFISCFRFLTHVSRLIRNFSFNEFCQQRQRFLPAEIAGLGGNDCGHTFLHNSDFRSTRDVLQRDRHVNFSRQVRVVEVVRVPKAFIGHKFKILPPKE